MDLLRHLRYYVVVAEELHFGRAAERLHMAQSPLSQRVRALEEAMGVELLVRTTRLVELTPAGSVLLDEARSILGRVERMESVMAEVRTGQLATLRLGLPHGVPAAVLASVVDTLKTNRGGVLVKPSELTDADQRTGLVDRRLDLGLLRWPVPGGVRHGAPVGRELGVLLPAGDPLLDAGEVELGALRSTRAVILPPRSAGPEQHDALLRTCFGHGYEPVEVLAAESPEFAAGLVITTDAVAIIDRPPTTSAAVGWRPLAGPVLAISVVAWRPDDRRPVVSAAAEVLRDALIASGGWRPADAAPEPLTSPLRPADAY